MAKLRRQRLDQAIRKFSKHQGLPHGSDIEVRRKSGIGRQVQGDTEIRRKAFGAQVKGHENVAMVLDHFVASIMEPNLHSLGCKAILIVPGEGKVNGNNHLRTVRDWDGLPTPEEIEDAEHEEYSVEATSEDLQTAFHEHEIGWNALGVARAAVRALVKEYGKDVVAKAMHAEGVSPLKA